MMKQILEIPNVYDHLVKAGKLYYTSEQSLNVLNLDSRDLKTIDLLGFTPRKIDFTSNYIVLSDSRNLFKIIDRITLEEIQRKEEFSKLRCLQIINDLGKIYVRGEQGKEFGVFDFETRKLVYLRPDFRANRFSLPYSYQMNDKKIIKYESISGVRVNCLDLDLSDLSGAKLEILDEHQFLIWFRDAIHFINTDLGLIESIDKYRESYERSKRNGKVISSSDKMWNIQQVRVEDQMLFFDYNIFGKIDLKTKEIESSSLFNHFEEYQVSGNWSTFIEKDNDLYCISDQSGDWIEDNNHLIFRFSVSKQTIVDQWQLPRTSRMRRGFRHYSLKVTDQYLSILEQDDRLHVLEI